MERRVSVVVGGLRWRKLRRKQISVPGLDSTMGKSNSEAWRDAGGLSETDGNRP